MTRLGLGPIEGNQHRNVAISSTSSFCMETATCLSVLCIEIFKSYGYLSSDLWLSGSSNTGQQVGSGCTVKIFILSNCIRDTMNCVGRCTTFGVGLAYCNVFIPTKRLAEGIRCYRCRLSSTYGDSCVKRSVARYATCGETFANGCWLSPLIIP